MISMTSNVILTELGTMALLGAAGQLARSVIGLYKLRLKEGTNWKPDWTFAGLSVITGAIVGIISGVILKTTDASTLIMAGYAGVDFIEGLLNKRLAAKGIKKG